MNQHEALIEARRRWGPLAAVRRSEVLDAAGSGLVCSVGLMLESKGNGPTWEDAFLDASRRSGDKTPDTIRVTSSGGGAAPAKDERDSSATMMDSGETPDDAKGITFKGKK